MTPREPESSALRLYIAITLGVTLHLSGCHGAAPVDRAPAADAENAKPSGSEAHDGVTVTTQQANELGIVTESAKAVVYTAETAGYGLVLPHDTIAAAVADVTTAQLTEKQTHAALARAQSLKGTPGALSAEVEETASRQSAADAAAEALAVQRLSAVIGLNPAWKPADNASILQALASGKSKLLRATFPLGTVKGRAPQTLRAAHLDAIQSPAPPAALGSQLTAVWDAPADSNMPGRSFFALLKGGDFAEGERLLVWAPGAGPAQAGVLVPAAALIISNGKYWCYLEAQPGHYRRVEVNTERPVTAGYVVTDGVPVGAKVVTSAAALLLARELNSDTDAD
jgi:hypothetical protein